MIGIILFIIGFIVRCIAYKQLQGDFSLELKSPNQIIKKGLYKYIRHPSYLGSLLMILGGSLIHPVLGIMLLAYAFFLARVIEEEKYMPIEYLEYRKQAGMFLPRRRYGKRNKRKQGFKPI